MADVVGEGVLEVSAELTRDSAGRLRDQFGRYAKEAGEEGGKESATGFGRGFSTSIGRVNLAGAIGKSMAVVGQTMVDALTLSANVAGGAIATILGTALTKGFGRLQAIDNAEASLRGLAATANSVPQIMEAATNAVTGTAFGLNQAAAAAAQFAAAGVPVGDMEKRLSALAKTAAAAGGDFDGVAAIFSKVAAGGKVTGEVLNQLTERGLAALPALADSLGVTAEEAQKLVSEGKVSFEQFSDAMDQAMGNIAIEQASTFQGLISNVGAAMGRFGAVVQRPIFNSLKAVLPGVMNLFNQLKAVIEPLFATIEQYMVPAAQRLGDALSAINLGPASAGITMITGSLAALAPVLGAVAAAFAGPLLTQIPIVGSLLGGLTGPVGLLAGSLVALFAVKPDTLLAGFNTITTRLPAMLESIVMGAATLIPKLAAQFQANAPILINGFTNLLTQLVGAVATIIPMVIPAAVQLVVSLASALIAAAPQLIQAGITLLMSLVQGIVNALPVLISGAAQLIGQLVQAIATVAPQLLTAGLQLIMALIDGILQNLPLLISTAIQLIGTLATQLVTMLPQIIEAALQLFLGIVNGLVQAVPQIISALLDLLPSLLESLIGMIPSLIDAAIQLFLGIVQGLAQAIPQIITALLALLPKLIQTLVQMIPTLVQGAVQLFRGIVTALPQVIPEIVRALIGMAPQLVGAIIKIVPQIVSAGADLIRGLINGIMSMAGQVGRVLLNIAKNAVGDFLSFLGIHSPSTLMYDAGTDTVQGYVNALDAGQKAVDDAMTALIPKSIPAPVIEPVAPLASAPSANRAAGVGYAATDDLRAGAAGTGAGVTVEAHFNLSGADPRRIALDVMDELTELVA